MMKSALSFALVASLFASTLPTAAQEKMEPTTRPIARAITREVARLAAQPTSSAAESATQSGSPAGQSSWGRVSRLSPGSEVILTAAGFQPGKRLVVAADYSDITVLNLAGAPLTPGATSRLRTLAAQHPDYFTTRNNTGWIVDEDGNVWRNVTQ